MCCVFLSGSLCDWLQENAADQPLVKGIKHRSIRYFSLHAGRKRARKSCTFSSSTFFSSPHNPQNDGRTFLTLVAMLRSTICQKMLLIDIFVLLRLISTEIYTNQIPLELQMEREGCEITWPNSAYKAKKEHALVLRKIETGGQRIFSKQVDRTFHILNTRARLCTSNTCQLFTDHPPHSRTPFNHRRNSAGAEGSD